MFFNLKKILGKYWKFNPALHKESYYFEKNSRHQELFLQNQNSVG